MTKHICPVCGYPDLDEPPYDDGLGSLEICPSCFFQFGFDDDAEHYTFEQWRNEWIQRGMPWSAVGQQAPVDWNPREQLKNIGIII